jgi:CRISPR-associated protein Cpf1
VEKLRINDKKYSDDYRDVVNENGENVFDNFVGFFGYFDKFIKNRENFYQKDGKAGRVATRSINENLLFFANNKQIYNTEFPEDLKNDISKEEKDIFEADYCKHFLLQRGISEYNYLIGGINKKINKYNQQNKKKIPFLVNLYRQILSMEERNDYKHIEIKNNDDLLTVLNEFIALNAEKVKEGKLIFKSFIKYCEIGENLEQIYLPKDSMNTISRTIFQSAEDIMALFNKRYFVSLEELKNLMVSNDWLLMDKENKIFKDSVSSIAAGGGDVFLRFISILEAEYEKQFNGFEANTRKGKITNIGYTKNLANLNEKIIWFKGRQGEGKKLVEEEKMGWIEAIKNYSDSVLRIYQITKYLWLPITGDNDDKSYQKIKIEIEGLNKNNDFYNPVNEYIIGYEPFVYRSSFQEYLTKRPFSEDKFKINFNNGRLLNGWDRDKISERLGVIIRDGEKYLLGIINKKDSHCLDDLDSIADKNGIYELMQFKQLTGLYRQLPRMGFPNKKKSVIEISPLVFSVKEEFDNFQKLKKENKIAKTESFDTKKLNILIDYYRRFIREYYKKETIYDFSLLDDKKNYEQISDFYADVDKITYSLCFTKINKEKVKKLSSAGKIFLFEIYCKDFSDKSWGEKNLHTLYFSSLFDANINPNGHIRLGANAEIFYRPASLLEKEQKNELIATKKYQKIDDKFQNPYHLKRYAQNKIFLHFPIILNADVYEKNNINRVVFEFIKNKKDLKIIGIDRGEKNLAYFSVINIGKDGSIRLLKSKDLNLGYLEPLNDLAKKRQDQRKAWQSISEIKGKRNGYISKAIHEIADLIINENAIVVFEDLSGDFKRMRIKFEKAVYQQLELALIKKLNYLTIKKRPIGRAGNYFFAYQLANQIGSYKDVRKQTGIIFYTQASYTSRTCPVCGWRKRIKGLKYKNRDKAKKIFDSKDGVKISFDGKIFKFEYRPEYDKKIADRIDWVDSDVTRIKWNGKIRKNTIYKKGELTNELKGLFRDMDIKKDINLQIKDVESAEFWEKLLYIFHFILEIRNTDSELGIDYIECPHCHFHSDNGFKGFEWNGDANGAYNIARKGLMILERIREGNDNPDLVITQEKWDEFTEKNYQKEK